MFFQQLESGFYANVSDLLRLQILYHMGGVYLDFDVDPIVIPDIELPLGISLIAQKRERYSSVDSTPCDCCSPRTSIVADGFVARTDKYQITKYT